MSDHGIEETKNSSRDWLVIEVKNKGIEHLNLPIVSSGYYHWVLNGEVEFIDETFIGEVGHEDVLELVCEPSGITEINWKGNNINVDLVNFLYLPNLKVLRLDSKSAVPRIVSKTYSESFEEGGYKIEHNISVW